MLRGIKAGFQLFIDAFLLLKSEKSAAKLPYRFAFLVHPRSKVDLFHKVPFLKYLPTPCVELFEYYWFPAVVAPIHGLKNVHGHPVNGYVISIPMTAPLMLQHRRRALMQIRRAVRLARNKGARIIGLGALTSSLTRGGLDLIDIPGVAVTTGHAYTGYTVAQTLLSLINMSTVPLARARVAIVGAAGSVGSTTAQLLVREGVRNIQLIDVPRKEESVQKLIHNLRNISDGNYHYHADLNTLKSTPFIITATNAPEALIKSHHIEPFSVIVDDAQPSDVSREVLERDDVIVAAAGAVFTPNIKVHFPMGLIGEDDNYCCMAEVMILAHQERRDHFVLDRPTLQMVDEVAEIGKRLSFKVARYQNEQGHLSHSYIEKVLDGVKKRHTIEMMS